MRIITLRDRIVPGHLDLAQLATAEQQTVELRQGDIVSPSSSL